MAGEGLSTWSSRRIGEDSVSCCLGHCIRLVRPEMYSAQQERLCLRSACGPSVGLGYLGMQLTSLKQKLNQLKVTTEASLSHVIRLHQSSGTLIGNA